LKRRQDEDGVSFRPWVFRYSSVGTPNPSPMSKRVGAV
jgi:hypothetical protein